MKYYSTQRPITPGSYPKSPFNDVLQIVNFDSKIYCKDIEQEAWGYIVYKEPIRPKDVNEFGLMPIPEKIKVVSYVGVDSWGIRVYKDQQGVLWKYCDPGKAPEERHDRLLRASSNELEGEPGWPMDSDIDYRIKE